MDVLLDTCGRRRVSSLLLLYLFVVKATADCPKPHSRENMVLTDKSLLLNEFLENTEATLECRNGYVIESGSGSMTCIDGNWTEPDLACKKKDCGPPLPRPNMSFITIAGTLFGDTIKAVCDKGFKLSGSSFKQCYAYGWSGKANCNIVKCAKPDEVANGRSSWDSQDEPKYGESIQYVCNNGYTLIGKDSITCSETGRYDSQPPACEVFLFIGVTTESDRITTETVTPTSTPTAKEASTSTDSSATPTAHRAKSVTTSATPTASPSVRGGRDILTAEGTTTVTSMTSSSFQDKPDEAVDTNKHIGYKPVVVSVICVLFGNVQFFSLEVKLRFAVEVQYKMNLFVYCFLYSCDYMYIRFTQVSSDEKRLCKWNRARLLKNICDPGWECQKTMGEERKLPLMLLHFKWQMIKPVNVG
ncbi:complement decay-accelerating factor isoform X3 [Perca flavescens]|uniref:complement decay-accelerating factor isoform X3 n=1 Tax=Perca flavescens TaxID=8167 RepID=UPI00106EEFCA|nr:complement decay-accelerating factor isoform X3 [Perca flavescens]